RVATIEVTTNVPDVDIAVDDVSVGRTPFPSPLVVSAGRRRVTAARPGRPPVTQIVELAGGDARKVVLYVAADEPAAPDTVTPPLRRVPVVPWVVTGVLAAGAIVTGPLALVSWNTLKSDRAVYPGANKDQISSDHTKTVALAATTDVLIGAAL